MIAEIAPKEGPQDQISAISNAQNHTVRPANIGGLQISFYVTTLLAEGLYVMLELASIPIPSSVHDMKAFIANLEDLMPLRAIYKKCIQIDSNVQQFQKEGASLQTLSSFLKSGKDRKRHCSFVFNH
ncbi:hypothetical protein INT47_003579 [Mucor saturninus]|uniref:Uncharacterized protein n=1 Tax=Mucor saturninus TaxID=64648 RepID=A0A8H7UR06_9FUNG|nr:hypothetical protein INT47_003579 [Mucor saturninus]